MGENSSGKTTTLNAMLYALLGRSYLFGVNAGAASRVGLEFTDGTEFWRGKPHKEIVGDFGEYTTGEAEDRLKELVGSDNDILQSHFIHSETGFMPLNILSSNDVQRLIRKVMASSMQDEIEQLESAITEIEELIEDTKGEINDLEKKENDLESEKSSIEFAFSKWKNLAQLFSSGQIEKVAKAVEEDPKVVEKIRSLQKKREGLRKKKRKLKASLRREKGFNKEVLEILKEATHDFYCPGCKSRIDRNTAEKRLEGGQCPFCGREDDLKQRKEELKEKSEQAQERMDSIEESIVEVRENRKELKNQIKRLKAKDNRLTDYDKFVGDKLQEYDFNLDELQQRTQKEVEAIKKKLKKCNSSLSNTKTDLQRAKAKLRDYKNASEGMREERDEKEAQSFEDDIKRFEERMQNLFERMAAELETNVFLSEDGDIWLPGGTDEENAYRRYYHSGAPGTAEKKLVNIVFVLALSKFANENEIIDFETIILDEPFDRIQDSITQNVLERMEEDECQFIIITENADIAEEFNTIIEIERKSRQASLEAFTA